jgi:hypothetical protein
MHAPPTSPNDNKINLSRKLGLAVTRYPGYC